MSDQTCCKPLRILLVDDSIDDCAAFRRAFEKSDVPAEITYETNAAVALQRLVKEGDAFDLVVTDHRLPGMNGLELCREVLHLEMPIALVILTGSGSEDLAVEALKAGVDDYLIKDPDQGYFKLLPVVLPEAVRRRNDRLARRLAEEALAARDDRLHDVLEKLEARNRELERFSQIIRQRFGPPLLSIETFAAELTGLMDQVRALLEVEAIDPAEKQRITALLKTGAGSDVGCIDAAARDMQRLIAGLGELIAVEQRRLRVECVDMDRLLGEVRAALTEAIEESGADVRIEPLPPCLADYGQTKQVFIHLLSNAVRAVDPERPGRIVVTAGFEDDAVVYCVEDNGVGIEPDRQKNLFDLLPPLPDVARGRGLGLSIVARIVDRLDGRIRVESEPGRGSRFYVALPAVAEGEETVAQLPAAFARSSS